MTFNRFLKAAKLFLIILILALSAWLIKNQDRVQAFIQEKFDQYFTRSVCSKPIFYKVGIVDSRFNLSDSAVLSDIENASMIWDKSLGNTKLFSYDLEKATLTINLIFDKRTALSNQINNLENQVKQKNNILQPRIDQYEQDTLDFKNKLANFNTRVDDLNKKIEYWNQKGGAPPDEYQKIIKEQENIKSEQSSLQQQADNLNQEARDLNLSTQDYNGSINKLNNTIYNFDAALSKKPEEGLFDPNTYSIDIYFDNNTQELIHTLAHEMGHALGLRHNDNQTSIMYPFSNQIIIPSKDDIQALQNTCSRRYLTIPFLQTI